MAEFWWLFKTYYYTAQTDLFSEKLSVFYSTQNREKSVLSYTKYHKTKENAKYTYIQTIFSFTDKKHTCSHMWAWGVGWGSGSRNTVFSWKINLS